MAEKDEDVARFLLLSDAAAAVVEKPVVVVVDPAAAAALLVPPVAVVVEPAVVVEKPAAAAEEAVVEKKPAAAAQATPVKPRLTWEYYHTDEEDTPITVEFYSNEECNWLKDKVKFSHSDKIGADGGFTNYHDGDANYNVMELSAMNEAVLRYSDLRMRHQWTQTGKELIAHAMAHDAIAKDTAILKMVANRLACCVGKDENGKPIYQYSDEQFSLLCVCVSKALSQRFKKASATPDEVGKFTFFETKNIENAVGKFFNRYIDNKEVLTGDALVGDVLTDDKFMNCFHMTRLHTKHTTALPRIEMEVDGDLGDDAANDHGGINTDDALFSAQPRIMMTRMEVEEAAVTNANGEFGFVDDAMDAAREAQGEEGFGASPDLADKEEFEDSSEAEEDGLESAIDDTVFGF